MIVAGHDRGGGRLAVAVAPEIAGLPGGLADGRVPSCQSEPSRARRGSLDAEVSASPGSCLA